MKAVIRVKEVYEYEVTINVEDYSGEGMKDQVEWMMEVHHDPLSLSKIAKELSPPICSDIQASIEIKEDD